MAQAERKEGVSEATDELAATLLGEALDVLAVGEELAVILAVGTDAGEVQSFTFTGDGAEACLEGARAQVPQVEGARRYAIAYEGAVDTGDGGFADAVLLEFGERGYRAYSAYSLIDGKGSEDTFTYTDPAPAGELEPLL